MRVLLSGGLGYLGSHLAWFLSEQAGHEVRILTRSVPSHFAGKLGGFDVRTGDVSEAKGLAGVCEGCQAVLQLAALDRERAKLDPIAAFKVSGTGTRNLLNEAAASGGPRFIFFSTFHVYGRPAGAALDEDSPADPQDNYSLAHYAGELYCSAFRKTRGLPAIRVRLSNGFGAPLLRDVNCWSLAVQEFCLSAFRDRKIVLRSAGDQKRDFISIPEILRVTRRLIEAGPDELRYDLYNLASGRSLSIKEIALRVKAVAERLLGREVAVEVPTAPPAEGGQASFVADITRIKELGFVPSPPEILDLEIEKTLKLLGRC